MFIRAANPIWYFVDLVGNQLNDQFYIFFLENISPYDPQNVYQDPDGTIPWAFPLQFNPNGTLPDNLYFNDSEVYRIEIRQGPTQTDPLIYEINNFVPGNGGGSSNSASITTNNQISNGQFFEINFTSPLTISVAGTYDIAPGWQLVLAGSGTCTLTQHTYTANDDSINNPPFGLQISTTDWSSVNLIQRFNHNGGLWTSFPSGQVGAVSGSITAFASSPSSYNISMLYLPSSGTANNLVVVPGPVLTGSFQALQGSVLLNPSDNTDTNDVAYVDIVIQLQGTGNVTISNIQLIGQTLPAGTINPPTPLVYEQETIERGEDHLFHYYKYPLIYKQIPSYLVGWDFPLNPAQFLGHTIAAGGNANASGYIWDQTILFQTVASGVSVAQGPSDELQLTANNTTQLAIVQYLDGPTVQKILNDEISVNLSAVSIGQNIPVTVSLWYTTDVTLPSAGMAPLMGASLITNLDANGKPSVLSSLNWKEIKRPLISQDAIATVTPSSTTNFNDYPFSGWNLDGISAVNTATFFAIVIGTGSITAGNSININSVGLVSGSIPTRPSPQTIDEVLRECQYYYEKSYDPTVLPGSAALNGSVETYMQSTLLGGNTIAAYSTSFGFRYAIEKRVIPAITFYSVITANNPNFLTCYVKAYAGASNNTTTTDVGIGAWNLQQVSYNSASYLANQSSSVAQAVIAGASISPPSSSWLLFHYTLNSQLGA